MALRIPLRRRKRQPPPALHADRLGQLRGRPYRLASDAWEAAPTFGFDALADAIAKVILESEPQLTLAVYGKWGVGKTTLLRAIDQRVSEQCVVAWFDMWEFKNQEHVIAHLLDAIADVLPQGSELARGLRKLARVALASASLNAGSVALSGKDLLAEIDQLWDAPKVETRQLERLVRGWRQQGEERRIVVIVDNLDRCLPELAVSLLEQITSLFGFPGVIFVLGADGERLASAVELKHGLSEGEGLVYLEKIVQVDFQVPELHRQQVVRWIETLVEQPFDLTEAEAKLLAETAEWNPRQIKRLLNNARIQLCTARYDVSEDEGLTLASTLLLHHSRDAWLALTRPLGTNEQAARRQLPAEKSDELIRGILGTKGGQKLVGMGDEEMEQFLSSSLSSLSIRSAEDEAVKASVQEARLRADLVCDLYLGGRGIMSALGLVGAVTVLEERGFAVRQCAGSSAGALVAALLGVGYTSAETREILLRADYRKLGESDPGLLGRAGRRRGPGGPSSFARAWVDSLLAERSIGTFGALRIDSEPDDEPPSIPYRLALVVTDVDREPLVVLPRDFAEYGLVPDEQPLTNAVLAAMASPGGFEPMRIEHEGGVSRLVERRERDPHPVYLFDAQGRQPRWPTIGVVTEGGEGDSREVPGLLEADRPRTILVPATRARRPEVELAFNPAILIYDSGRSAAEAFLSQWDFGAYVERYRGGAPAP